MAPDDPFPRWLAACDDALAAGDTAASVCDVDAPPELRDRLRREAAWCRLVRDLLPLAGSTAPITQLGEPEPLRQLGRFRIERELGRGAFGIVFLAHDPQLNRDVALKVPRPGALVTAELRERFRREARAAAGLDHPGIVAVHDVGEESGVNYIAYGYCPGQTLADWLKRRTEPVPYRDAGELVRRLADAIEHAHQRGVLHRDLKPSNILLAAGNEMGPMGPLGPISPIRLIGEAAPKITDFGLARSLDAPAAAGDLTGSAAILGTPNYMAPEQAAGGSHGVGAAADVYALGAILYEILTGRPPLRGDTPLDTLVLVRTTDPVAPSRLRPGVPRDLETICLKCLHKDPPRRYPTAGELAADLNRYLNGEPVKARRIGTVGRMARWARRNPARFWTIVVAAFAMIAVAATSFARVVAERDRYRSERERAVALLYRSSVDEARALRLARTGGYRARAWERLQEASRLDTPERDPLALRLEAAASLGDPVGFAPAVWTDFPPDDRVFVMTAAITPDGRTAVLGLMDHTLSVRRLPDGQELARLRGHTSGIYSLAMTRGGHTLVSADDQGHVKVWTRRGEAEWTCERTISTGLESGVPNRVHAVSVALSPDGRRVFTCPRTASGVVCHDLTTGKPLMPFIGPRSERLHGMAVSADGKWLAAVYRRDDEHGLLVWEIATRKLVASRREPLDTFLQVSFAPDSRRLICAGQMGVAVFDAPDFKRGLFVVGDAPYSATMLPGGRVAAIPSASTGNIRLWDVTTNREVADLPHPGQPHSVAFSGDGNTLLSLSASAVRVWDLGGGGERIALSAHERPVASLSFSSDGKALASAGHDGTVKLWRTATGELLQTISDFKGTPTALAFHPSGRVLATADNSGAVRLWDLEAPGGPRSFAELPHELSKDLWRLTFNPTGNAFAVAGVGGVMLWRSSTSDGLPKFDSGRRLATRTASGPCFSPEGDRLAWVDDGGRLNVSAMNETSPRRFDNAEAGAPDGVAFLPGQRLASITRESQLVIRNADTGEPTATWSLAPADEIAAEPNLAATRDGTWLAVSGARLTIWDVERRQLLLALPRESSHLQTMTWTPTRRHLAAAYADGRVLIWDVESVRARLRSAGLDD